MSEHVCPASISGACLLVTQGYWAEGGDGIPCMDGCELDDAGESTLDLVPLPESAKRRIASGQAKPFQVDRSLAFPAVPEGEDPERE